MAEISGREDIFKQFDKLGLLPKNCTRIVLDFTLDNLAKVYYETIADAQLIELDIPSYLGPKIKGNHIEVELKESTNEQTYRWVSVMDKDTCEGCRARNGTILTATQVEDGKQGCVPPLHSPKSGIGGCRCEVEEIK